MDGITIKQVSIDSPDYQQVYDLREAILRKPIGLSLANEDLSQDKKDVILAAFEGDIIKGCVMLLHKDEEIIKFRQMAVADDMQGKGIGKLLMLEAEQLSKEKSYKKIVLHARETAAEFYSRLGYKTTSGLFTEVGIPHYVMEKDI